MSVDPYAPTVLAGKETAVSSSDSEAPHNGHVRIVWLIIVVLCGTGGSGVLGVSLTSITQEQQRARDAASAHERTAAVEVQRLRELERRHVELVEGLGTRLDRIEASTSRTESNVDALCSARGANCPRGR